MIRRSTTLLLIACPALALCAVAAESESQPTSQPTTAASAPADYEPIVRELVTALAGRSFAGRQRAGERIAQLPPEALPALRDAYRAATSSEVRTRIRHHAAGAVETWVRRRSPGFLGVRFQLLQLSPDPHRVLADSAPAEVRKVILLAGIVPGSPAEQAGLQAGMQVSAVNGLDVSDFETGDEFAEAVRAIPAGGEIALTVDDAPRPRVFRFNTGHRLDYLPEPQQSAEVQQAIEAFWQAEPQEPEPVTQPTTAPATQPAEGK